MIKLKVGQIVKLWKIVLQIGVDHYYGFVLSVGPSELRIIAPDGNITTVGGSRLIEVIEIADPKTDIDQYMSEAQKQGIVMFMKGLIR
jgi:hypothetical protein